MIKEDEIIKIDTNEDWIRVQEILFYYNFMWIDSGKNIFLSDLDKFPIFIGIKDTFKMFQRRYESGENIINANDYIKKFETPLLRKEKLLKLQENGCGNKNT